MPRILCLALLAACLALFPAAPVPADCPLGAPTLDTNPGFDVVVTRTTPLLSFANARGGVGERSYELELSTRQSFAKADVVRYVVDETGHKVSAFQIPADAPLADDTLWWWRVRAVDEAGAKGPWAVGRFFVDTESDDAFMHLTRALPVSVKVSSGADPGNLVDYSDQGLATQWRAAPPGEPEPWAVLDMGEPVSVSRIWMLAAPNDNDGWPTDFTWLASNDGVHWQEAVAVKDSRTYRHVIDIDPVEARFWRLVIHDWTGYSAALNEILLYSPGAPEVPAPPRAPYVLVVGNQHDGGTFTELARRIEEIEPRLKTLTVPHHKVSLAMYEDLSPKPVAVVLSGNNASYDALPMFEYNGEFELIRAAPAPMLGICAGHQMLAFAWGYTRVRSMGWSDITAMDKAREYTRIEHVGSDPLLDGLPEPFTAAEVHSWAVYDPAPGFSVIAESSYLQAQRGANGRIHGVQFHPEIKADYNQAEPVLRRFLERALEGE